MNETTQRTLHFVTFVFLFFWGPVGWLCIYLLYERWNPKTSPKKRKNVTNKNGFSEVGLLIAATVVILIGLAGWRVYYRQNTAIPAVITKKSEPIQTSDAASDPTLETNNKITLQKMKLQFSVPDSLKSLIYIEKDSTSDQDIGVDGKPATHPIAIFSLPEFETVGNCNLTELGGPLGILFKVSGQYPTEPTDTNTPGVLVKQFPDFYTALRPIAMNCGAPLEVLTGRIKPDADQLKLYLSTLKEI